MILAVAGLLLLSSPQPRTLSGHSGAAVGDKVFVTGGDPAVNIGRYFSDSWLVDVHSGIWQRMPSAKVERAMGAAVTLGGKVYVAGGIAWPDVALSSVEVFNPDTMQWSAGSPMHLARSRFALVTIGRTIFAVSGLARPGSDLNTPTIEAYDPSTNEWRIAGKLNHPRHGFACVVVTGRIFVFGGNDESSARSAEVWNPLTGKSTDLPDMPNGRGFGGAAVISASKIVCFGGRSHLKYMDAFDPETNKWLTTRIPDVESSRFVSVQEGHRVWIIGGENVHEAPIVRGVDLQE